MSSLLKDLLDDFIAHGETLAGSKSIWREQPLSLVEFFKEDLGEKPFPGLQTEALEIIDDILNKDNLSPEDKWVQITEVVLLFGKGSGKDFLVSGIVAYVPYWLNCMHDPQGYFNFGQGENIDIINLAKNAAQAENVFFTKLKARLRSSNWFKRVENRPPKAYNEYLEKKGAILFYNNIRAFSGHSEAGSFEGYNPLVAIFDEIGDYEYELADFAYKTLKSSSTTRFGRRSLMIFISFPRSDSDYIMYKYGQGQSEDYPEVMSLRGASWEVNPNIRREDLEMEYLNDPEGSKTKFESLTGDSLIWTRDGSLCIKDIKDGAYIMTAHGKREVALAINSGKKAVFKVTTDDGYEITGSINHPMKVYSNKKGAGASKSTKWVTIGELRVGDPLYVELSNNLFGSKSMSVEMAAMIGMTLSDGTFHQRPDGRKYICWYFGKNLQLLEVYKDMFEKEFNVTLKVNKRTSRAGFTDYYLRTDSQSLIAKFEIHGLAPGTAHTKTVPMSIFQQDRENILHFLKAYIDADGCVHKRSGSITIGSCNKKMLTQLQHLFLMVNVKSRVYHSHKPKTHIIQGEKRYAGDLYTLSINKHFSRIFIKQIALDHIGKMAKTERLFEDTRSSKQGIRPHTRVVSIEYVGEEDCYDLYIEPEHEFVANGLGVHNCIPPLNRGGFFQYPERIDECVKKGKSNPVVLEERILSTVLDNGEERHFVGYDLQVFENTLELDTSRTYYLGLDGGIEKDMFTLSLFHAEVVYEEVIEGGEAVEKARNKPVEDLLVKFKPDSRNKIPVSVQNVIDMVEIICRRVFVKKALSDKFNSGAMIQTLQMMGVEAEDKVFSNPFQLAIYTQLKNLAYSGYLELLDTDDVNNKKIDNPNDNLKNILLINGNKIDHEKDREKDTCDARCTAVYLCANDEVEEDTHYALPSIAGAQRNY